VAGKLLRHPSVLQNTKFGRRWQRRGQLIADSNKLGEQDPDKPAPHLGRVGRGPSDQALKSQALFPWRFNAGNTTKGIER